MIIFPHYNALWFERSLYYKFIIVHLVIYVFSFAIVFRKLKVGPRMRLLQTFPTLDLLGKVMGHFLSLILWLFVPVSAFIYVGIVVGF